MLPPPSPEPEAEFDSLEQILEPQRPPVTAVERSERTEKHSGPPASMQRERRARPEVPTRPDPELPATRRAPWGVIVAIVLIGVVGGGLVLFRDQLFGDGGAGDRPSQVQPGRRP